MSSLEQRVAELWQIVQNLDEQFHAINATAANGFYQSLNQQELRVLGILSQKGQLMMRALADHLHLAGNSMTTIVDGLEKKDLVRRQRSDEDRRVVQVELTERGKEACKEIDNATALCCQALLEPLTPDEQEILMVLFRKLVRGGHV
jgi:DNA-binding MarR family transcriptional regulator